MDNAKGLLALSEVRRLMLAQVLSIVGSAAIPIVLSFAVLYMGGGVVRVGLVLGLSDLPFIVLLVLGGALADRMSRRVLAMASDLVRAGAALAIAILLATHSATFTSLVIIGMIWGAARAFFTPTLTGLVPELVAPEALLGANGMRGAAEATGNMVGPAVAGIIIASFSPAAGALFAFVTYMASAFFLFGLSTSPRSSIEHERSVLQDLKIGYLEVVARPWCWRTVLVYGVLHLTTFGPLLVLGPVIAHAHLGGAGTWGLLLGAQGAGGLMGALGGMRSIPKYPLRAAVSLSLVAIPGVVAIAFVAPVPILIVGMFFFGAAYGYFGVIWETTLQQEFAPEVISKVSSYDWMGSMSLLPLGQALAGISARWIGPSAALLVAGAALGLFTVALLFAPSIRGLQSARPPIGGFGSAGRIELL